jgi:hypothetical protein
VKHTLPGLVLAIVQRSKRLCFTELMGDSATIQKSVVTSGEMNGEDAETTFKSLSSIVSCILGDEYTEEQVEKAIELIDYCSVCVEKEFLISKNEQIEDINTETLKVLLKSHSIRARLNS